MTTISVVLPTYNRAHCLARAVQGVITQDFKDWELILVDDGSTDETEVLRTRFQRALGYRYVERMSNHSGASAARNIGIAAASGEYIAFLDSDDFWLPEKLMLQLNAFRKFPDAVFSFTNYWLFNRSLQTVPSTHIIDRELEQTPYPMILQARHNVIMTPTVMARRDAIIEAGGFDESMAMCEDLDLWLRINRLSRRPLAAVLQHKLTGIEIRTPEFFPYKSYATGRAVWYAKAVANDPMLPDSFIQELYREIFATYRLVAANSRHAEIEKIFAAAENIANSHTEPLSAAALYDIAMKTAAAVGELEGEAKWEEGTARQISINTIGIQEAAAHLLKSVGMHSDLIAEEIHRLSDEVRNSILSSTVQVRAIRGEVSKAIITLFKEYVPGWRVASGVALWLNELQLQSRYCKDGTRLRVLILDFDSFSTVGGGQTQYRVAIKNNPHIDFFYPSSGPDLKLFALEKLPQNAHPFFYDQSLDTPILDEIYGNLLWGFRDLFAARMIRVAAAVQGMTFHIADMQAFFPAAHLVRPIMAAFGVTIERVVIGLTGWVSVSLRNSYASEEIPEPYIDLLEQLETTAVRAADIRYTVSVREANEQSRGGLPVNLIEMANAIDFFGVPDRSPPGDGPPDLWFVGRMDGAKGPDVFVELVARLPRHLYRRCFLAGPDNNWAVEEARWSRHVLALAASLGVEVQYLGELTREEIRDRAYRGRAIVVVPSRNDAFNYVSLEAILNGCVVLLSERAGVLGYLRGHFPHLVPATMSPDKIDEAASVLLNLMIDYQQVATELRRALREQPFPAPQSGFMEQIYRQLPAHDKSIDDEVATDASKMLALAPLTRAEFMEWRPVRPAVARPRISVVIPVFNRPSLLAPKLASLMRQSHDEFEVVVLDYTIEGAEAVRRVAEGFGQIVRYVRTDNRAKTTSINRGIKEARGEYFVYLPDDDIFAPELLEKSMAALDANPEAIGCYPDWDAIDLLGYFIETHQLPDFDRQLLIRAQRGLPGPGALLSCWVARAIGGRDPTLCVIVDDDFWLRATAHGSLVHIPQKLAYRRLHGANVTV